MTEKKIVEQAHQIRSEAPGIGAYKMFVILKAIFSDIMPGRDRFYKIINKNGLMLKPEVGVTQQTPTITTTNTRT